MAAVTTVQAIRDGQRSDLENEFRDHLREAIAGLDVPAEYDSTMQATMDFVELELISYEISSNDGDVKTISTDWPFVTAEFPADVTVRASTTFEFSVHDSVDDDDVGLGSEAYTVESVLLCKLLVTLLLDEDHMAKGITATEISTLRRVQLILVL